jgi:hypothetical protein
MSLSAGTRLDPNDVVGLIGTGDPGAGRAGEVRGRRLSGFQHTEEWS